MDTTTDTTEAKLTAAADAVHFSGDLDELGQRFGGSNHIRRPPRACRTKCG